MIRQYIDPSEQGILELLPSRGVLVLKLPTLTPQGKIVILPGITSSWTRNPMK
jgi:hypothetical protein